MTHHRLPAGTDVAEMALFDVDALPHSKPPDAESLEELVAGESLVRLSTGADGGYLLHLHVDESPPEQVLRYCLAEDKLTGHFASSHGRIAFGGVESAFQTFKPNRLIRSDAVITPGRFSFTAYHTDIPDEVINQATRVDETPAERWLNRVPLITTLMSLGVAFTLATFGRSVIAGLVLLLGYVAFKTVKRLPAYKAVVARRNEAQLAFPSIVIEMRSTQSATSLFHR